VVVKALLDWADFGDEPVRASVRPVPNAPFAVPVEIG
jgi:hypothetical protein